MTQWESSRLAAWWVSVRESGRERGLNARDSFRNTYMIERANESFITYLRLKQKMQTVNPNCLRKSEIESSFRFICHQEGKDIYHSAEKENNIRSKMAMENSWSLSTIKAS